MAKFEGQERRMPKIEACLKENNLGTLDDCRQMLLDKGIDVEAIVKGVQPICFDNAVWAYTLGTAIAVKRGLRAADECASAIGTVGLSMGITADLSAPSHVLLILLMYFGRVGPLTLAYALANRLESQRANRVHYPEEKIMIG